jgi:ubiquinone biosynthesis protein COQ4
VQLRLIAKGIRAYRQGRLGDAAAFKAAAFGAKAYPEIERRLRELTVPFPTIDLTELRNHPSGSFGWTYARFMEEKHLRPFTVSPEAAEELARSYLLAVRYPLLHDAFHVLLDFDTSLAGELGVWAFVSAQRYGPAFDRAASLGRILYPLVAPWRTRQLRESSARGRRLAAQAVCLIAQPLERYWPVSLQEVRETFGVLERQR